jgi:RNA polymerase sigma-70 factor (ECF subfamily)
MSTRPGDITKVLARIDAGESGAVAALMELAYDELRELAQALMRSQSAEHTLQPTALVNEAFLKLIDQRAQNWESKSHFLAIASTAMRRVLLEHARARLSDKRGAGNERVTLFEVSSVVEEEPAALVALDKALEQFAKVDPEGARIVELRWFVGLPNDETARVLGVSTRTVERGWRAARAWLRERLDEDDDAAL